MNTPNLQFFVKEPSAGKTLVFNLPANTLLKEFLEKISDKTGWPSRCFFLTRNSKHINTYTEENLNMTLQELQITEEITIVCHPKLSSIYSST